MFCIFCRDNTSTSRSVEHVIPESLGNTTLTLPRGVVCDKCNNYFARKIEKPLLGSAEIIALRFHQRIPSKKKIIPSMTGTVGPSAPVIVQPYLEGPILASVDASPEALDLLFNHNADVINIPEFRDSWDETLTSRFLAKVAVEALAVRLVRYEGGVSYLATEAQFDPIRNFARRGGRHPWPYHNRRIYPADRMWTMPDGRKVQRVHESEILHTAQGEYYFVLALFGLELTINYGEPTISGYLDWLNRHDNASPLYFGKNADDPQNGV